MAESTHKYVNDLGVAAYILMFGYAVIGKKGRAIYFECNDEKEVAQFEQLILEYQPPNEFYTFDSCLMFLKKMNDQPVHDFDETLNKTVTDLGIAAYILMKEYNTSPLGAKVIGKEGKKVHFSFPEGKGQEFEKLSYQYLPSAFHTYDSNLMSLKKIGEYMPHR